MTAEDNLESMCLAAVIRADETAFPLTPSPGTRCIGIIRDGQETDAPARVMRALMGLPGKNRSESECPPNQRSYTLVWQGAEQPQASVTVRPTRGDSSPRVYPLELHLLRLCAQANVR